MLMSNVDVFCMYYFHLCIIEQGFKIKGVLFCFDHSLLTRPSLSSCDLVDHSCCTWGLRVLSLYKKATSLSMADQDRLYMLARKA